MRTTRRALCILNTSMSMNRNKRVSAEDLGRAFQDLPVSVEQHCLRFPLDEALMVNRTRFNCGASTRAVRGIHVKNRLHRCRVSSATCCKGWRREYCCPRGSM